MGQWCELSLRKEQWGDGREEMSRGTMARWGNGGSRHCGRDNGAMVERKGLGGRWGNGAMVKVVIAEGTMGDDGAMGQ